YPEMAAAGLWTTPRDLARYVLGVSRALDGARDAVISRETAEAMLTSGMGGWGLGPGVAGAGDSLRFSHGGANEGYRAFVVGYPQLGKGAALMTNSDAGGRLYMEILRSIALVYDW
ncbi:MAG: serine hydrolase, partial [Gammaproteobacteria bacterium]|nr:beta-lactamase family protein [Gemmatimonadota bacterium]NIU73580.1 serine hydrolase [Gammaproteobacteria bacterium]NIX19623.1 serine hydrolase [Actinomycetota bacterium]